MNETAAVFITEFYNLQGETVKAKQNNLFKLLRQYPNLKSDDKQLDLILEDLKPRFHLEKIFYIDFLIYFRRFKELYNFYKSGDRITVKKLARQEWFFEEACKEISSEEFVNVILPSFSYSLKLKILKKLPFNESKCDEFFEAVSSKYGIHLATRLLPKCSTQKISEVLKTQPVKLTNAQLETIAKKDANLVVMYLEERVKHEEQSVFMNGNPVLVYIAQKHPAIFSKLFEKYNFQTKLGRRTTKKFVDSQKSSILGKTNEYFRIVNIAATVRKIGPEIKDVLFKNALGGFNKPYWQIILKYYPKKHQFNIFEAEYNSAYHEKFGDNIDNISEAMLKIVPDPDQRQKLAILKMQKENKSDLLKFTKPEYCFSLFLEKINHSTLEDRIEFVKNVTFSCVLNRDVATLLKVAQMLSSRFRNDDIKIPTEFFIHLLKDETFIGNLNEACWNAILQIVSIVKAKGEWIWNEHFLARSYLEFLKKENKSLKEAIKADFDWIPVMESYNLKKYPKLFDFILRESIDSKWAKFAFRTVAFAYMDCTLGFYYYKYNKKHPERAIDIAENQRLLNSCKEMILMENSEIPWISSYAQKGIAYIIFNSTSKELERLYFKNFQRFGSRESTMWLLKNKPQVFLENFDDFSATFTSVWGVNCKRLWNFVKKMDGLDAKAVEFFKLKLSEEGYAFKTRIVKPLTMLSQPEAHLEYIKQFVPTTDKVDLTDDETRDFYLLQGRFCRFLPFLKQYKDIMDVTFEFCKGDYLQLALAPLYSSIYNLPENETKTFVEKISSNKALSVKKHALHLSCVIYDNETVFNCLKQSTAPSLIPAIKYFSRNPSSTLWNFIEALFGKLKKSEVKLLKVALTVNVPFEYKSRYLELIWNVLNKYENQEVRNILISKLNKGTIPKLEQSFAFNVIENSIFIRNESQGAVCAVLIYVNGDEKFKVLRNVLQRFKEKAWDQELTQKIARQKLKYFVVQLFKAYMDEKEESEKFVTEIESIFMSSFPPAEIFEELILFQSMKFKNESAEYTARTLSEINEKNEKEYGIFAVNVMADVLSSHVLTETNEKLKVCYALLQCRKCLSDSLLIAKLLPTEELKGPDYLLYKDILDVLKQATDKVLLLQLNLHLKYGLNADN